MVLLGYLRQATTHIGRGENSGRTLTESNIVAHCGCSARGQGQPASSASTPPVCLADATYVAVLVYSAGQGAIVGAAAQPVR